MQQGIRSLIAEAGGATAEYMLVEPSNYHLKIVARSERMPMLIGERIGTRAVTYTKCKHKCDYIPL